MGQAIMVTRTDHAAAPPGAELKNGWKHEDKAQSDQEA